MNLSLGLLLGSAAGLAIAALMPIPSKLFTSGAQGVWYDPSDFSTLFQDSTGTTPVTAVEQPVGRMLDRSGRGNHASQATSASRPVLRARYNLFTQSDDLTSFIITPATGLTSTLNATTAPTGAATARRLTNTVTTEQHRLYQGVTLTSGAEYTYTVYLKNDTAGWAQISFYCGGVATAFANINLATGALGTTGGGTSYSVTSVGNGWYRLSITATTEAAGCNVQLYVLEANEAGANPTTTGTVKSIFVWGAQLLTSADQTSTGGAYQRVAAATDYDTSNPVWRPYLAFDGVDDNMATASIDFSATDEVTLFAGVTKLGAETTTGIIDRQNSANPGTNKGVIGVLHGVGSPNRTYDFRATTDAAISSTVQTYTESTAFNAPSTNVLTGQTDASAPLITLRVNGSHVGSAAAAQGGGNFGNFAFTIGSRTNSAAYFNGRLYSLAVLGRTATAAEISAMEAWVNGKTGAF